MPHGENVILVVQDHVPVRAFMKDIAEESSILNPDAALLENARRLAADVPEEYKLLTIFVDVFEGYFRHLSHILAETGLMQEDVFWELVAGRVAAYQEAHPQRLAKYRQYDLYAPDMIHSCLNRLQLANNLQMVNLADPIGSFQMAPTWSIRSRAFARAGWIRPRRTPSAPPREEVPVSRELDELLALTATRARPGRPGRGRIREHGGPPGGCPGRRPARVRHPPGADNAAAIRDLRDWWLERHPEAGLHYLALRCWGLLIWQPIYLGMIAAHRSAIAPDLGRLDQPVVNGFICGYSIGRHDPLRGCLRQRMDAIAAQLRQICAAFYRELTQVLSLNPRAAACMQADCVLSALLAAQRQRRRQCLGPRDRGRLAGAAGHRRPQRLPGLSARGPAGHRRGPPGLLPSLPQARRRLLQHLPQTGYRRAHRALDAESAVAA